MSTRLVAADVACPPEWNTLPCGYLHIVTWGPHTTAQLYWRGRRSHTYHRLTRPIRHGRAVHRARRKELERELARLP